MTDAELIRWIANEGYSVLEDMDQTTHARLLAIAAWIERATPRQGERTPLYTDDGRE